MNLGWNEAMTLLAELAHAEHTQTWNVDVALFPPAVHLRHFHEFLLNAGSAIGCGAQDCSAMKAGAFTGELSAPILYSAGARFCLVGHSERRQYHNESSDLLLKKVKQLLEAGMAPVFCCGESLEQREEGGHHLVIEGQLAETIFTLTEEEFSKVIIAYEPVWAIGTGKTASPEQAQDIHLFIRGLIHNRYNSGVAEATRILYGGSVKPENAGAIFSQPDVDGGLIGGASLEAAQFLKLISEGN